MDSYITSHSKTTRGRKGRSTTSAALTFVLMVVLRVSLVTNVLAGGHLWGAGEPRPIYRRMDVPGIYARHTYDSINGPSQKTWPVGDAADSPFSKSAPLILNVHFCAHGDQTTTSLSAVRAAVYRPWGGMSLSTGSLQKEGRGGPIYLDPESGFQRAHDQKTFSARGRALPARTGLGRAGNPDKTLPYTFGVAYPAELVDPKRPQVFAPACWDGLASYPDSCRRAVPGPRLSLGGSVRLVSGSAGGVEAGGGASGHPRSGAGPGQDLFKPYTKKLAPYFRICTSDMITPVPFNVPGTRVKACAMACKCDDGAFGIGLYSTKRLASLCSVAAESICPWQIKTISPSSPVGLTLPMQFTDSQIVACRLLESRPWE